MKKVCLFVLNSKEFFLGLGPFLDEFSNSSKFESFVKYELEVFVDKINYLDKINSNSIENSVCVIVGGEFGFCSDTSIYDLDEYNPLICIYNDVYENLSNCFEFTDLGYIIRKEDGLLFNDIIYFVIRKVGIINESETLSLKL